MTPDKNTVGEEEELVGWVDPKTGKGTMPRAKATAPVQITPQQASQIAEATIKKAEARQGIGSPSGYIEKAPDIVSGERPTEEKAHNALTGTKSSKPQKKAPSRDWA